jgi:hypothetical protein
MSYMFAAFTLVHLDLLLVLPYISADISYISSLSAARPPLYMMMYLLLVLPCPQLSASHVSYVCCLSSLVLIPGPPLSANFPLVVF